MSNSDETPAGLVSAIKNGDAEAEGILLKQYYPKILFILRKRTGDPDFAQDICQETFRIILERLRSRPLDEPEKLASYIHSTAINLHIAEIRKSERRQTYPDSELLDRMRNDVNVMNELLRERSGTAVRTLLDELSNRRDRQILYHYYIEELEKEEICRKLDLGIRHFDKVISRARKRFRDLLNVSVTGHYLREELIDNEIHG